MIREIKNIVSRINGHRSAVIVLLCLFGLSLSFAGQPAKKKRKAKPAQDQYVYLEHADELRYDETRNRGVQILTGKVVFRHNGARLRCDSANFMQDQNRFEAFGHVHMTQGDTLELTSDYAYYDGMEEMIRARKNVVLRHRKSRLYTDNLDYDRRYSFGYFEEGGKLVDGNNVLVADWGKYNTSTKQADFYYDVVLTSPKYKINTDTLFYDTNTDMAHVVGPSVIHSDDNVVTTTNAFYNTKKDQAELFSRSTIVNKGRTITGDSLYHDSKTGISEGFMNVVYVDSVNKNELHGDYCYYDENKGFAIATKRALAMDYSQADTLYMHSDSIKLYTYNIDTDSVYREVYCYGKVRAFRNDVQAVCDTLIYTSIDSCMTMKKDPIVWNDNRQLLGEVIKAYMNDSTVEWAHVIGQAFSIEQLHDSIHFNQISSKEMMAYFDEGNMRRADAIGNVITDYFQQDDKDSTLITMTYMETDTMRMYLSPERRLERIWTSANEGTVFPITQIPPEKEKLPKFAWFDYIRPLNKDDIWEWRGKSAAQELKEERRREAPKQRLKNSATATDAGEKMKSVEDSNTPVGESNKSESIGENKKI